MVFIGCGTLLVLGVLLAGVITAVVLVSGGEEEVVQPEETVVQQPEEATTKQVTVEISSDVPADVSIIDDNFDVNVAEEITGSETYEFEIAADSGLIVDASSEDLMTGNISIAVYENGELIAEDNSSEGYAQVIY